MHLTGYARPTIDDIENFRQLNSPCAGHPESFMLDGIETTTGPLGQGLAAAVGMAIAERHLNALYGDELVDHRTYVIAGDGCLMEGVNHEAAGLAGHLKLGRLIVLWDDNRITIDGSTDLSRNEDVMARYDAMGWHTVECDGMDSRQGVARRSTRRWPTRGPSLIRCKTIIGYGAPNKQGTAATHGVGARRGRSRRRAQGTWAGPTNRSSSPTMSPRAGKSLGARGAKARAEWHRRVAASRKGKEYLARIEGKCDDRWLKPLPRRADRQAADGRDPQGVRNGAWRRSTPRFPRRSADRPT